MSSIECIKEAIPIAGSTIRVSPLKERGESAPENEAGSLKSQREKRLGTRSKFRRREEAARCNRLSSSNPAAIMSRSSLGNSRKEQEYVFSGDIVVVRRGGGGPSRRSMAKDAHRRRRFLASCTLSQPSRS